MKNFVWNPAWCREGESLWSIVNKIASANNSSVPSAMRFLVGQGAVSRSLLFVCALALATRIRETLIISSSALRHLFIGYEPLPLGDRQYLSLGLRWCPVCLEQAFHSNLFQDWRRLVCPWHKCRLQEHCPRCQRSVDPFGEAPWSCNYCSHVLYKVPPSWVTVFKAKLAWCIDGAIGPSSFGLETIVSSESVTHCYQNDDGLDPPVHSSVDLSIQAAAWAFEDMAALTESIAQEHADCIAGEARCSQVQLDQLPFSCPVAGALTCVSAWFGFMPEVRGGWPSGQRPLAHTLGSHLRWQLEQMPAWSRRLFVRESLRGWLVDCLQAFSSASEPGGSRVSWQPKVASGAAWFALDNKVVLKSHCDWPGFSTLIQSADAGRCASGHRS